MEFTTPSLFWFITGIMLFFMELAVPGFILFFFGVGAWLTALLCLTLDLSLGSQILIFTVASVISLVALRGLVSRSFGGDSVKQGDDSALAKEGDLVEVVGDIVPPSEGKVKYGGTTWRARSATEIKTGEMAMIVKQDTLVLEVTRLEKK